MLISEDDGLFGGFFVKRNHVFAGCVVLLLVFVSITWGGELRVGAGEAYGTIQSAVNAAVDGDVVIVGDGTYTGDGNGDILINGKSITVRSEKGPESCIIDCESLSGYGFRFEGFAEPDLNTIELDGFTVIGGSMGGIKIFNSSPTIKNCVIRENREALNIRASSSIIQGCRIINNSGGMSDPVVKVNFTKLEFRDCLFRGNRDSDEDIAELSSSTVVITSCIFTKNRYSQAVYRDQNISILGIKNGSDVSILNSVFSDNNYGKNLVEVSVESQVDIRNSIFRPNLRRGTFSGFRVIGTSGGSSVSFSHNILEGGIDSFMLESEDDLDWGEGNKDVDPMLTEDLRHLLSGSPCIDSGDPDFDISTLAYDIDGETRIHGGLVDIGLDEFIDSDGDGLGDWFEELASGTTTEAVPDGDPDGDGLSNIEEYQSGSLPNVSSEIYVDPVEGNDSWSGLLSEPEGDDGPKRTIQAGIDACVNGQVILSPGTYRGEGNRNISFKGKPITVRSIDPEDPSVVSRTVIDCEGSEGEYRCGFYFHEYEGKDSVLAGVSIMNGSFDNGGGICVVGSGPIIRNCRIYENRNFLGGNISGRGGGVYHSGELELVLESCTIVENISVGRGSGIYSDGNIIISGCLIGDNFLDGQNQGCIYLSGKSIINRSIIRGNYSIQYNDYVGIYYGLYGDGHELLNSLVVANGISNSNVAISTQQNGHASVVIRNCTVAGNSGTGIKVINGEVINSIVWGNSVIDIYNFSQLSVNNSNIGSISNPVSGTGNISFDPLFVDSLNGNYGLRPGSPCINSGDEDGDYDGESDFEGNRRVSYGRVDMGAYEFDGRYDLDGDSRVDFSDFVVFARFWMADDCGASNLWCGWSDFNSDGHPGMDDFVWFADNWLYGVDILQRAGFWNLDNIVDSVAEDGSQFGRDGKLVNTYGSLRVRGWSGKTLTFDGVDDYVKIEGYKGILGVDPRTVCAWVRTTDTEGEIISWGPSDSSGGRWVLLTQGDGFLRLEVGGGAIEGSTNICDGRWHHVAAVLGSYAVPKVSDIKLYVDGIMETPTLSSERLINTVAGPDVKIGLWSGGQRFFKGLIDEIEIYEGALNLDALKNIASFERDLQGYWTFDEDEGSTASDESIFRSYGKLLDMNENPWVEGKIGNALSFDGVDDRVQVMSYKGVDGGNSRSVCAWIKTTDIGGEIISWGSNGVDGGRWDFMTDGSGFLKLQVGGGAIVGSTFVCDGQWHHIAVVLDSDGTPNINEVVLYLDGFPEVASSVGDRIIDTKPGPDVKFGVWGGGQQYFNGLIDEVRIYGRGLSRDEIEVFAGIYSDAGDDASVGPDPDGSGVANLSGRIISFETSEVSWSLVSGPGAVVFEDVSLAETTARLSGEGEYVLRLTVVDGDEEVSDEVTITVRGLLPLGVWSFDGSSGDVAADSSVYLRDATLLNMDDGAWVEGKAGNCLSFDGVDDIVRVFGYPGIGGGASRTVCAWIKTTDTAGQIVSWGPDYTPGGRWIMRTEDSGYLRLEVGSGAIVGSTVVCDGEWRHVTVVLDNDGTPNVNEVKLYVDGVLEVPSSVGDMAIDTVLSRDFRIGFWGLGDRYFEGLIDELRIYDRALSLEEISELAE